MLKDGLWRLGDLGFALSRLPRSCDSADTDEPGNGTGKGAHWIYANFSLLTVVSKAGEFLRKDFQVILIKAEYCPPVGRVGVILLPRLKDLKPNLSHFLLLQAPGKIVRSFLWPSL